MKKHLLSLAFAVIAAQNLFAQHTGQASGDTTLQFKNSIYFEFAASSYVGASFNYERFLSKNPGGLSIRAGLGMGLIPGIFRNDIFFVSIPVGLSYNIPISENKHNFIELGGTCSFILSDQYNSTQYLSALTSFRHVSKSGKTQIRVTMLPYVYSTFDKTSSRRPWFGFSIGQRF